MGGSGNFGSVGGDFELDLALNEEHRRSGERISGGLDILRLQSLPGAGHDDRGVFAVGAGEDRADAGRLLCIDGQVGRVDPYPCQCGAELIAEDVATDAADQEGAGAVEGGLRRLVTGLPAGREGNTMTDDALTRCR